MRYVIVFVIFVDVLGRGTTLISSPGQIRKEYELHIQKLEEEEKKRLEAERKASEELIRTIQVG
jgi:hypothetical protein